MTADELLFAYGSLRERAVQLATFGRPLEGHEDTLVGYTVDYIEISDPRVTEATGTSVQPILRRTGNALDKVRGLATLITDDELDACDEYEAMLYTRVSATLVSGSTAWIYVSG